MSFFNQLPPSVLQAGAIFLSIIIEALPFVLIGSIISGFIEVYITPDKVYRYLPKNKWCRIWYFYWLHFPFLRMWNCPYYQSLFGKESTELHSCTFYGDSAGYQSHCSFCDLLCFREFL